MCIGKKVDLLVMVHGIGTPLSYPQGLMDIPLLTSLNSRQTISEMKMGHSKKFIAPDGRNCQVSVKTNLGSV